MTPESTLIFFCGKMAAGKSTLARALAAKENAVLLVQDDLLDRLYPGEILTIPDFVRCSTRLRLALTPLVHELLSKKISVVLDFPGNTTAQRGWFRELFDGARARHELHYVDVPDEICKSQLRERSKGRPVGSAWTTEAEFEAITAYFQPPSDTENFNVVHHVRT